VLRAFAGKVCESVKRERTFKFAKTKITAEAGVEMACYQEDIFKLLTILAKMN
jgi:hypothetical protein